MMTRRRAEHFSGASSIFYVILKKGGRVTFDVFQLCFTEGAFGKEADIFIFGHLSASFPKKSGILLVPLIEYIRIRLRRW